VLQITKQQMAIFEAVQQRRYEDEVIARLRENFEQVLHRQQLDESILRLIIRQTIERASKYQILNEYDVTRFIEYVFEYGGQFETLPWAAAILNAGDLAGDEKMDRLDVVSTFTVR
jgi:hypothetical protein